MCGAVVCENAVLQICLYLRCDHPPSSSHSLSFPLNSPLPPLFPSLPSTLPAPLHSSFLFPPLSLPLPPSLLSPFPSPLSSLRLDGGAEQPFARPLHMQGDLQEFERKEVPQLGIKPDIRRAVTAPASSPAVMTTPGEESLFTCVATLHKNTHA